MSPSPMLNRSLKVLREQRRLKVAEVAEHASIAAKRLSDFEAGERKPSRKQLERLAAIYGVPLYALFRDAIPNIPETPPDFRKKDPGPAALSPRGMKSLWVSERISRFTHQLATELKYTLPRWSKGQLPGNEGATALRSEFDRWLSERTKALQLSGPPEQQFITAFRLFFEVQLGVVNVNDAPSNDYLGFYVEPEGGVPSIFVNRVISSKKAQLFTLVHEYAHAMMRVEGISNPFIVKNKVERFCNNFAAEFLAPIDEFNQLAEKVSASIRKNVFQYVAEVSQHSLLSKHATAIRLKEAGYVSPTDLQRFEAAWAQHPAREKDEDTSDGSNFGVPHAKRISELGHMPVYLAAQAVSRKLIDSLDVQAGIGLSETLQTKAFDLAIRRVSAASE